MWGHGWDVYVLCVWASFRTRTWMDEMYVYTHDVVKKKRKKKSMSVYPAVRVSLSLCKLSIYLSLSGPGIHVYILGLPSC